MAEKDKAKRPWWLSWRWDLALIVFLALAATGILGGLAQLGAEIGFITSWLRATGLGVARWLGGHGLRIVLILVLARVIHFIVKKSVPRAVTSLVARPKGRLPEEIEQRVHTLSSALGGTVTVIIAIMALFMVLPEFGVNITAVVAGLGIAGLAVGFGGQWLVKDIISGIFILAEDQFAKGDVVSVAGKSGLVEDVNIRRTVLRDLDGIVHVVPNGEITVSSNFTKDWSRVNLNIPVAYDTDLDQAMEVLNRVAREMAEDHAWKDLILETPRVWGVEAFSESSIDIKVVGSTKPIRQWDVMREYRKRVKQAFDREGIEIPFPYRTLVIKSMTGAGLEKLGKPPPAPKEDK